MLLHQTKKRQTNDADGSLGQSSIQLHTSIDEVSEAHIINKPMLMEIRQVFYGAYLISLNKKRVEFAPLLWITP